jgi:hypothetical protein
MHAQQSYNVCNTAIQGYHGDKIILYKNVKNIKYVKITVYLTIKYVSITDNSTVTIWLEQSPEFWSSMFSSFVSHFRLDNGHLGVE